MVRWFATIVLASLVAFGEAAGIGNSTSGGTLASYRLSPVSTHSPTPYLAGLSTHWLRQAKLWMGYTRADQSFIARPKGQKIAWYREGKGRLRVSGARLDRQAPPLVAHIPAGYGTTGFQSSGITFSTPGCWVVVAHVGPNGPYKFYVDVT